MFNNTKNNKKISADILASDGPIFSGLRLQGSQQSFRFLTPKELFLGFFHKAGGSIGG